MYHPDSPKVTDRKAAMEHCETQHTQRNINYSENLTIHNLENVYTDVINNCRGAKYMHVFH